MTKHQLLSPRPLSTGWFDRLSLKQHLAREEGGRQAGRKEGETNSDKGFFSAARLITIRLLQQTSDRGRSEQCSYRKLHQQACFFFTKSNGFYWPQPYSLWFPSTPPHTHTVRAVKQQAFIVFSSNTLPVINNHLTAWGSGAAQRDFGVDICVRPWLSGESRVIAWFKPICLNFPFVKVVSPC